MSITVGQTFSLADQHRPLPGCTTSTALASTDAATASVFALAAGTDISAESYAYPKLLFVNAGDLEVFGDDETTARLTAGDLVRTPLNEPIGTRTANGCTYTELIVRRDTIMNDAIKAGEAFRLADLLPYQEGTIVNMDVAHNDGMKLALMSFDAGTGLQEHAAPADALIFALEGEGVIGYEGKEHTIHAGENFRFAKDGRHYVRADRRFKMALLLVKE